MSKAKPKNWDKSGIKRVIKRRRKVQETILVDGVPHYFKDGINEEGLIINESIIYIKEWTLKPELAGKAYMVCHQQGTEFGIHKNYHTEWMRNGKDGLICYLVLDKAPDTSKSVNSRTALFDRVVMPAGYKTAILEAMSQDNKDKRDKLWVEWGFDDIIEKGKGLIFLFYGPPGTGKTMCAQGIAAYLNKKYIMLSSGDVNSSVPGECERNIAKAFDEAKKAGHIIIIDECDSLLYKRSEVGVIMSAHINALLTCIEKFDGVCVLTTNRSIQLDPALERRVVLKLEFEKPDEVSRAKIWRNLVPKKCPLHPDVCFKTLAKYDLSGGNIKNAILSAARKAIFEGKDCVSQAEFVVGVEREISGQKGFKKSHVVRPSQGSLQIGTDRGLDIEQDVMHSGIGMSRERILDMLKDDKKEEEGKKNGKRRS